MRLRSLLGLVVVVCAAAHAAEQDACAECKNSALADASQCQAVAAPDPALRNRCDRDFAQATRGCAASACKAEAEMLAATQCAECLKQADGEARKCASLPPAVRAACEARVATAKKTCEDKSCPAAKPK
jgi:hypothetical protein